MRVERTKKGHAAIWECGGSRSGSGRATIVTGKHGEALRPVFIKNSTNGNHALIIVEPGCFVIQAERRGEALTIQIKQLLGFCKFVDGEEFAEYHVVATYEADRWFGEKVKSEDFVPHPFEEAVLAAITKVYCYSCRQPRYVKKTSIVDRPE